MTDLENLQQQKQDIKQSMERRDRALKLYQNRDFKAVVLDYFCGEQCARYAQVSGDPAVRKEEREEALAMAQAAGHLRRFFSVVILMGNHGESQLEAIDAEIDALQAEGA